MIHRRKQTAAFAVTFLSPIQLKLSRNLRKPNPRFGRRFKWLSLWRGGVNGGVNGGGVVVGCNVWIGRFFSSLLLILDLFLGWNFVERNEIYVGWIGDRPFVWMDDEMRNCEGILLPHEGDLESEKNWPHLERGGGGEKCVFFFFLLSSTRFPLSHIVAWIVGEYHSFSICIPKIFVSESR